MKGSAVGLSPPRYKQMTAAKKREREQSRWDQDVWSGHRRRVAFFIFILLIRFRVGLRTTYLNWEPGVQPDGLLGKKHAGGKEETLITDVRRLTPNTRI